MPIHKNRTSFKRGHIPWNKDKTWSKEVRGKMRERAKELWQNSNHRKKMLKILQLTRKKGLKKLKNLWKTKEYRNKMSETLSRSLKGQIPWNKNKRCPQLGGKNNPNWKNALITFECLNCNNNFRDFISKDTSFCSKKCAYEYRKKMGLYKGENNPNWLNGSSFEPYSSEFNTYLKLFIIQRDNFTCQLCDDVIPKQTKRKFLCAHHIDYNKKNNNPNNLITLCNFCNSSVNKNREDWTMFFQNKLRL